MCGEQGKGILHGQRSSPSSMVGNSVSANSHKTHGYLICLALYSAFLRKHEKWLMVFGSCFIDDCIESLLSRGLVSINVWNVRFGVVVNRLYSTQLIAYGICSKLVFKKGLFCFWTLI